MHDDANIIERPDPRIARAESWICDLEDLRRRNMKLARAKSDQACRESEPGEESEAASESPKGRDPAEAFDRACRVVRLTVALEARVGDYLHALVAGDPSAEFWPRRVRQSPRPGARLEQDLAEQDLDDMGPREWVRANVLEIIDPDSYEEDECERIYEQLDERLYESERYDEFLDLPMEDLVNLICKDLGVEPNWGRWEGENWPAWRKPKPAPPPQPCGGDQTLQDPLDPPDPLDLPDPVVAPGALAHPPPTAPAIIPHDLYPDSG